MDAKKRLVVGMSGASGALLGIELLRALRREPEWETHLVISRGAEETINQETNYKLDEVLSLADRSYSVKDLGASIASGTFKTEGMVVVPCSMKTLAGIASGYSDNLLLRAADVTIKERRKLVLVARETPLSSIHLRNMLALSDLGVTIMPPVISYYNRPVNLEEQCRHFIGKILDAFGIDCPGFKRWGERSPKDVAQT
ncbi:MAG TPA: UbiX family flavin prenyltransferase [Firmicutes bacterium]|nr:UbiX family flavin prenyltransferase [Bacillota bacterium]